MHKNKTGLIGEFLSLKYLKSKGYKVHATNWYCRWGEIDLIASFLKSLVFVEVKTVKSGTFYSAKDLFNINKRRKLLRSIGIFLCKNNIKSASWRLDLICVTLDHNKVWIEHYKNVLAL